MGLLVSAELYMPITPYLDDFDVNAETNRVLGVALEKTRISLGLGDNFADGIIAKRIVELAKAGERHPDLLCEGALKILRGHLFGD
jgi:hypothetical protein